MLVVVLPLFVWSLLRYILETCSSVMLHTLSGSGSVRIRMAESYMRRDAPLRWNRQQLRSAVTCSGVMLRRGWQITAMNVGNSSAKSVYSV